MAQLNASTPNRGPGGVRPHRRRGHSVVELVVVMGIVAIMIGVSVWAFAPRERAYAPDDVAIRIEDFLREASQRAVAERQTMRVLLDRANRVVRLVDEGGMGPDTTVREERLPGPSVVQVRPPSAQEPPDLPEGARFTPAEFGASGVWEARFLSNGAMVDMTTAPAPLSAAFYVWPPANGDAAAAGPDGLAEIRVVTVFGPTAQVRVWRHDGARWVRR
jgi:Tfp pilus assembly protein FimT